MKWSFLLWGILFGIAPLVIGVVAAEVDPHGAAAQMPWYVYYTMPVGLGLGLLLALLA
jgi:hypothetical protein